MSANYTAIKGNISAINEDVLVVDMSFDEYKTEGGLVIPSDDGKVSGIKPRWGKVYSVGPEQKDVKVDDWILVEHGRWSRGVKVEVNGEEKVVFKIDTNAILLVSEERPNDIYFPLVNH